MPGLSSVFVLLANPRLYLADDGLILENEPLRV